MRLAFEYGNGHMNAELPDDTDVFIPGETIPDPPCILPDRLVERTRESLRDPVGMEPLSKLAFPGAKAVIIFPDRVKGDEHATVHRKVCIPLMLEELYTAGVRKEDVLLCSNGLHAKNTNAQIRAILGDALYAQFSPYGQILNHDELRSSRGGAHESDLYRRCDAAGDCVWHGPEDARHD